MITKDEFEKAVEYCTSEGFCSNCLLVRKPLKCGIYLAEYIKENEPAPAATGTSSSNNGYSQEHNTAIYEKSQEAFKDFGQKMSNMLEIISRYLIEVQKKMSETERKAFEMGEMYFDLLNARDDFDKMRGGDSNDDRGV